MVAIGWKFKTGWSDINLSQLQPHLHIWSFSHLLHLLIAPMAHSSHCHSCDCCSQLFFKAHPVFCKIYLCTARRIVNDNLSFIQLFCATHAVNIAFDRCNDTSVIDQFDDQIQFWSLQRHIVIHSTAQSALLVLRYHRRSMQSPNIGPACKFTHLIVAPTHSIHHLSFIIFLISPLPVCF